MKYDSLNLSKCIERWSRQLRGHRLRNCWRELFVLLTLMEICPLVKPEICVSVSIGLLFYAHVWSCYRYWIHLYGSCTQASIEILLFLPPGYNLFIYLFCLSVLELVHYVSECLYLWNICLGRPLPLLWSQHPNRLREDGILGHVQTQSSSNRLHTLPPHDALTFVFAHWCWHCFVLYRCATQHSDLVQRPDWTSAKAVIFINRFWYMLSPQDGKGYDTVLWWWFLGGSTFSINRFSGQIMCDYIMPWNDSLFVSF